MLLCCLFFIVVLFGRFINMFCIIVYEWDDLGFVLGDDYCFCYVFLFSVWVFVEGGVIEKVYLIVVLLGLGDDVIE